MDELGVLMTAHSKTNSKLKEENTLMSKQMHEILRQYEERQDKYEKLSQEHKLHVSSSSSNSSSSSSSSSSSCSSSIFNDLSQINALTYFKKYTSYGIFFSI